MRSRVAGAFAGLGIAALVVAGCGSSSKSSSPTTTGSTAAAGSTGTTSGSGGSGTSGAPLTASAPGVTKTTITIGLMTSLTGNASSTFADTADGAQAAIDAQNAKGGVNGRKLELVTVDDQSSPAQDQVAAQNLVQNKHAFAIVGYTPYLFGGYQYLQKQGIPVTGAAFDGPEWGLQPNTNMFSYVPLDAKYPATTIDGLFLKSIGVTSMAGFAYGVSPSSIASIKQMQKSVVAAGLKAGYTNLSVPFGGVDFTADVLQMKKSNVNGFACSCVESSDLAVATAAKQGGLSAKGLFFTGYSQSTLTDPTAAAAAQDQYFTTVTVPYELHQPATDAILAALKQYDPHYKGGDPDYGLQGGYLATQLMIKGLEVAGQNPTRQSFISGLHGVSSYDADGALASPVSFALADFGKYPQNSCAYFVQLKGTQFVPTPKVCGTLIPNSDSA
jgi:branched-chain amino acid transport system substrate-binding protein